MSSKGMAFLAFVVGAGMGSVCTWKLLKRKYELIAQEEIDSVKAAYATREIGKGFVEGFCDGLKVAEDRTQKDESNVDFKNYASIIQKEGYTDYSRSVEEKKGEAFVEKPYVISPEEFGEFEEYEKISLTYYADKVLADENDEEVDDVDEIVGEESLNHFGEYEDDSVFVRNDRLKCDYEILLDQRNYSDVAKTRPHRVEE
ncbi:hypothetical protein K5I21_25070 [[Clostridium] symbiosum]|uniref:Uncharacterized protein n=1 Tax=Clostridium symbiosum TaxID=1512 RepID=A0AAW5FB27_CLOSY|nr:hypothetical protein [[Clostridium] symbiosum]MCK0089082.1 hypothetical protein [[Clostridium] symbiosum]